MNEDEVTAAICGSWAAPHVEALAGRHSFVVRLPTHRMEHDDLSLVVERDASGDAAPWRISDDGYLLFMLGEETENVLDRLAGTPLLWAQLDGHELVSRSSDSGLGPTVVAFARQVADILTASNALEAVRLSRQARRVADSSARLIAREMRSQLSRALPRMHDLYRIDRRLSFGQGVAMANVPLAVNRPRGDAVPPALVATALDLTGPATAIRSALGTTSLVMDLADKLGVERRFLLVRGESNDRVDLGELYDRENVVTVATDAPEALIASVRELERELLDVS